MKMEIQVPTVGESITTGVIVTWLAATGDQVEEGEALFELETDKASLEIPSPGAGTLEILVEEGAEVEIGQTVATLTSGEAAVKPAAPKETPAQPEAKVAASQPAEQAPSPPVAAVSPTPPAPPAQPPTSAPPPPTPSTEKRRMERKAMTPIRKRIAKRLVEATQTSAYLTTFNEIDMQKVIDIRSHYKDQFLKEHGIKIGFMSFFVKACCQALKEFPDINTEIDGSDIIYKYFYDIGVAVSLDDGLVVPVIRDAETMHFADIEAAIASLARRARDKKLLPDELRGGTFTITNGGIFGSLLSTPIPAYPQTAILGMHAIKKRPVVIDDKIIVRPMMYVALTYDHRVIDGRQAVRFLARVKDFIEEPDMLLLEL